MTARDLQLQTAPRRLVAVALAVGGAAAGASLAILLGEHRRATIALICSLAALAAVSLSVAMALARRASAEACEPAPRAAVAEPPAPAPPPTADDARVPVEGEAIDASVLESLRKLGGDAFVAEVVSQFISEGVLCLLKLAQAIAEGDVNEYAAQIHALRSSAANVGAQRLYKLCLEWRALAAGDLEACGAPRFVLLQKEFAAAEAILKGRRPGPGAMAGKAEAI